MGDTFQRYMTENRVIVEKAEPEPEQEAKPETEQEAKPETEHRWVQRKDRTAYRQHSGKFKKLRKLRS